MEGKRKMKKQQKKMKLKRMGKWDKGITLLALVISIIILLILAGISIAMLTGQNRRIKQSRTSENKYENSTSR